LLLSVYIYYTIYYVIVCRAVYWCNDNNTLLLILCHHTVIRNSWLPTVMLIDMLFTIMCVHQTWCYVVRIVAVRIKSQISLTIVICLFGEFVKMQNADKSARFYWKVNNYLLIIQRAFVWKLIRGCVVCAKQGKVISWTKNLLFNQHYILPIFNTK